MYRQSPQACVRGGGASGEPCPHPHSAPPPEPSLNTPPTAGPPVMGRNCGHFHKFSSNIVYSAGSGLTLEGWGWETVSPGGRGACHRVDGQTLRARTSENNGVTFWASVPLPARPAPGPQLERSLGARPCSPGPSASSGQEGSGRGVGRKSHTHTWVRRSEGTKTGGVPQSVSLSEPPLSSWRRPRGLAETVIGPYGPGG